MNAEQKAEIKGWVMYDWANSVFGSTVLTTFLGPYLAALIAARPTGTINVLGYPVESAAFYPFCVTISVLLQVLLLPILTTIADYTPLKKRMLLFFAYVGAIATMLMVVIGSQTILLGGFLFIVANLSFGASIAFYNAFLPDIAPPDDRNSVSAQGFAYGYFGGGLLLFLNLGAFYIFDDPSVEGLVVRLCLASAGVWWLVFTFWYPHRRLKQRLPEQTLPEKANIFTHGVKEFIASLREMYTLYPMTLRYLIGYLIFNDGIQTVISVATIFALTEINMDLSQLAPVILMVQFVAAGGSVLFNQLAQRIGAKATLMITLVIWAGLLLYAYFLLFEPYQFWILAFIQALVLGSSQALSRSLFSQIIPTHRESAYFGLYEISDRGTSWIGPLVFAFAVQLTGSARVAMLPLIVFFIVGLTILYFTNIRQAIQEAGNEIPKII